MADIVIDHIQFQNYRQYETGIISFSHKRNNKLSILVARNGTGKTTFLNSITWCLYEEEFQLSNKAKALPLVNTKVLNNTEDGKEILVSVAMTILDGVRIVEFKRSQSFKVITNDEGKKDITSKASELIVSISVRGDFSNTDIRTGNDALLTVTQYFDKDIYDFYFFDGENLKQFFDPGRENDIKRSINNIAQVSLLENVCNHVRKVREGKMKKITKEAPNIQNLYTQQEEIKSEIQTNEETITKNKGSLSRYKERKKDIEKKLNAYTPIHNYITERDELEKEMKNLDIAQQNFDSNRSSFIRRYSMLFNYYPYIKHVYSIIQDKENGGELPPKIDIEQVKYLLENLDVPCPICDHEIGESGRKHLEKLLHQYSVSSRTSNFLREIKGAIEFFIKELQNYKKRRNEFLEEQSDLEARKKKNEDRLKEIRKFLINYEGTESGQRDIKKLEADREKYDASIDNANRVIGAMESANKILTRDLDQIESEIQTCGDKLTKQKELRDEVNLLSKMESSYQQVLSKITSRMKNEIEDTTKRIFDSMNWKMNSFGEMKIGDNYSISIFNDTNNFEATGSLSATEQMALAYAFILSIHQTSGKNCPLVIDSPIGRSSDENRENIAKALMEVSENKQIIMLFTPDDFTPPVRRMYEAYAEIHELSLSDDEKSVEGIDK